MSGTRGAAGAGELISPLTSTYAGAGMSIVRARVTPIPEARRRYILEAWLSADGAPLPERYLDIFVDDQYFETIVTDDRGRAVTTIPEFNWVDVVFEGDEQYEPCSARVRKPLYVPVLPAYPLAVFLVCAFIISVAATIAVGARAYEER